MNNPHYELKLTLNKYNEEDLREALEIITERLDKLDLAKEHYANMYANLKGALHVTFTSAQIDGMKNWNQLSKTTKLRFIRGIKAAYKFLDSIKIVNSDVRCKLILQLTARSQLLADSALRFADVLDVLDQFPDEFEASFPAYKDHPEWIPMLVTAL